MANFTGTRIKDTYQRVIQIDGGEFQDGLGNSINIPFNQLSGSGTLISGSTQIASDISGSITSFSSSISSRVSTNETDITSLQSFSSSLNATYATDAEVNTAVSALNAATSSYLTSIDAGIISSSKQISDFGFISSSHTDIAALNTFTGSVQSEVNSLNAATSSYLTSIDGGIVSSSKQITDFGFISESAALSPGIVSSSAQITAFGFISSSHTDIAALNLFTGSVQTEVNSLNAATSSYLTSLTVNTLDELADVNNYSAPAIIDSYRLAWDSGSQEWAPAPSNTLKGTTRLFISTTRSNSSTFFFNSITRTATDSPSPVADSAFLLTSALLSKVTVYLRNDAVSANACTVEVFKNADGAGFATASSIATDSGTLNTDVITTFSFTGLTLAQFDSIHIKVTPSIAGGQYYGIVIIE